MVFFLIRLCAEDYVLEVDIEDLFKVGPNFLGDILEVLKQDDLSSKKEKKLNSNNILMEEIIYLEDVFDEYSDNNRTLNKRKDIEDEKISRLISEIIDIYNNLK